MQPWVYCPSCARKLESDGAFCPGCGRSLRAAPAAKAEPKAGPLWPWLLAVAVIVIPLVVGMVAMLIDPSCPDAATAVLNRHQTLFGLINTYVGPLDETCSDGILSTAVAVKWTAGDTDHVATYRVSVTGSVTPVNATAYKLDQISAEAPGVALSALRFLP